MKKISIILLVVLFISTMIYGEEWISFSGKGEASPEYEIFQSNSSSVEFEVDIPGMDSKNVDNYNRVYIPEHTKMDSVGFPEVLVVTYLIAIPQCDNVDLNITLIDSTILENINIYPAPELVEVNSPEGYTYLEEQFAINEDIYSTDAYFPGYSGELVEKGAVRAQHCIRILIYPVQFNPVQQKITAYSKINISMTFNGASGSINEDVGICNEVCGASMINYNSNGLNASISCGAGRTDPGYVTWVTEFTDDDAIGEYCDYLIITHQEFWENPDLHNLADKRANYNGFDVVIVKTDDIDSQINDPPGMNLKDKIKTLIKNTYESNNANHTYDGKLGYVNLFGDNKFYDQNGNPIGDCVPTHSSGYDVYFSQLTIGLDGNPDVYPDILLGRCPVDSDEQVANVCQKIIDYEPIDAECDWDSTMTFLVGWPFEGFGIYEPLKSIAALVNSYTTNLLVYPEDMGTDLNFDTILENSKNNLLDKYASGNLIFTYFGHGLENRWTVAINRYSFNYSDINNDLYNHKLPLIYSITCHTGAFQSVDDCMAEKFFAYDNIKGSIGFIGSSEIAIFAASYDFSLSLFNAPYLYNLGSCGEILMESKINICKNKTRERFNLFGDPALNILLDSDNINECDLICNTQEIDINNNQNQNLNITAGINNHSQVEVTDNFKVDCNLTNTFLGTSESKRVTIDGIASMGEVSASFDFNVSNYVPGDYEVKITVDVFDDIEERDEDNNITTIIHDFYRFQDGFPVLYSYSQDDIPNVPLIDNGCIIIGNKKISSDGNQIWENDLETYGLPLPLYDNDTDETDYIFLNSDRNKLYKVNGIIGNYVEIYLDPGNIYNYCLGDVNNDGELELICNAQCDDSPITDQRLIIIDLSNNNLFYVGINDCEFVNDIAIGDGNNDGKNEIYVLDRTNEQLKRYEMNNDQITLTDYMQFNDQPRNIVLEDFNMDGDLDCFIVTIGFELYLLDCSSLGFEIICEMQQPNRGVCAVSAGDIYNDGNTDIFEIEKEMNHGGDESSEVYLISINDNQFSRELLFSIEDSFDGIIPYDFNSDNILDLLLYQSIGGVDHFISGYTISGNKLFQVTKRTGAPVICDIDNDGDIELIFWQNAYNYDNKRKLIVSDLTINTSNHGNIYPKMNKYNNNLYCQPVTGSLSEEATYHWNGSFTLHNDVILPENSALYIMPGSVIKAQNRSKLSILGSLTAKGAENYPIKFIPNIYNASVGYWAGIEFIGNSLSDIIYCQIENAATGIYAIYQYGLEIYNSNFEQNITGISFENCGGIILYNIIKNNSVGIELLDSSPYLKENNISNNQNYGVYVGAQSYPKMEYGTKNLVSNNGDCEIYMTWGHPLLFNGHNDFIHESDGYILAVYEDFGTGVKSIPVQHNWWGHFPPEEEKFYPALDGWFQWDPADEEPNCTQNEEKSESKMAFDNASLLEENGDYSAAIQSYKCIIEQYPDSDEAEVSLSRIFCCEKHLDLPDFEELTSYYDSLSNNSGVDTLFSILSRNLAIECKIQQELYDVALNDYDNILLSDSPLTDSVFTVINIMKTLMLADTSGGKSLLNVSPKILAMKPYDMNDYFAKKKKLLGKIGYPLLEEGGNEPEIPNITKLYQNYPNPMRTSTKINYTIPKDSKVELRIYNIKGQLVKTVVSGKKEAGYHYVTWDGRNDKGIQLSNGIYFYQLSSENIESEIKKMILLR